MRRPSQLGLTILVFAVLACKSSERGAGEAMPPAAPSATATTATTATTAATATTAGVEVRVPREAAMKLLDLCSAAAPSPPKDPAAPEPQRGEIGVYEKDGDNVASVRLFGLRPDSPLGKASFLNGDRVIDVSGVAPGAPKERWDSLRSSNRLDVRLVRRGTPMTIGLILE